MDLFGGYGSDSDNEGPVVVAKQPALVQAKPPPQIVQTRQPLLRTNPTVVAPSSSKTSVIGQQKKVKKLDISFLPPEIQAALARGDSTRDSDDDEPGPINVTKSSSVNKASGKPLDEASCKLLGMLPAPKGHDVESTGSSSGAVTTIPVVPPSVATKETTTTAKPAAPKSSFSFGYCSTETVRSGQGKTSSVSVSVESKPEVPVMPWFQDIQKPIEAVSAILFSVLSFVFVVCNLSFVFGIRLGHDRNFSFVPYLRRLAVLPLLLSHHQHSPSPQG